jgi:hypothetical protein
VLLQALEAGFSYRVTRDAIPAGARVIQAHACGPDSIALLVESDQFAKVDRGDVPEIDPVIEKIPTRIRARASDLIH